MEAMRSRWLLSSVPSCSNPQGSVEGHARARSRAIHCHDRRMKKRVLIISTSAGTGHVRAAQALEKEFARDPRWGR